MSDIKIPKDEMGFVVSKIKNYFNDEFDQDIGSFEAEFLIDFFSREIGPHFYNKGLSDAYNLFSEKNDEIGYMIQELEKTTR